MNRIASRVSWCLLLSAALCLAGAQAGGDKPIPRRNFYVPPGFKISLYKTGVPNARSLAVSPSGVVFVGTRRQGAVYAVLDNDRDGRGDEVLTIASNLRMPNGVAFRDGALYVAELNRILRFDNIEENLRNPPAPVVVRDDLPSDRTNGWKFIRFGPDGKLYLSVGAPCNVCERDDPRYASILRMNPDGSELEIFARGVRSTTGFDWHPVSKQLWFTDTGRRWMSEASAPDELNLAPEKGLHFGFPYCHGDALADPVYGKKRPCSEFVPAAKNLDANVAALGMRFYTGEMFPPRYRNQVLIAEQGSWSRSVPSGFRITLVRLNDHHPVSYEVFAEGWHGPGGPWWRPVDLEVLPDGSLIISDDNGDALFRITYQR